MQNIALVSQVASFSWSSSVIDHNSHPKSAHENSADFSEIIFARSKLKYHIVGKRLFQIKDRGHEVQLCT